MKVKGTDKEVRIAEGRLYERVDDSVGHFMRAKIGQVRKCSGIHLEIIRKQCWTSPVVNSCDPTGRDLVRDSATGKISRYVEDRCTRAINIEYLIRSHGEEQRYLNGPIRP